MPARPRTLTRMFMKQVSNLERIRCAFCHGRGVDPFGIMSPEATCQVCNGLSFHLIVKPHEPCAYCHATGVEVGTRNTCLSCGGRGRVSVSKSHVLCGVCHGRGAPPDTRLRCGKCGGVGVVNVDQRREL